MGQGAFKFHITKAQGGNDLIMIVSGNMGRMRDFLDVVADSVKPSCITRVYFLNKKNYKEQGEAFTADGDDFYWFGCPPTQQPCDGMCVSGPCQKK